MINFIALFIQPAAPRRSIPDPPGLPIDNGILILFLLAIVLGLYIHFKNLYNKQSTQTKTIFNFSFINKSISDFIKK